MKADFKKPLKIGLRIFSKGEQVVPDQLAHTIAFKKAVASGDITVFPKDEAQQQQQSFKDAKAIEQANAAHKLAKSAQPAPGAVLIPSGVPGLVQDLLMPAKPISEGVELLAPSPAQDDQVEGEA